MTPTPARATVGAVDRCAPPASGPIAAGPRTTGVDLASYLRRHAPMPPYRAAVFASALADQLAALHAAGRTPGPLPAAVRVETDGWHRPVIVRPGLPDGGRGVPDDIAQVGLLLADLVGAPAGHGARLPPRPGGVPAQLWSLVTDCLRADARSRPTAAVLSRRLRDTARDLLLDGGPTPPGRATEPTTEVGVSAVPGYVPSRAVTTEPEAPAGRSGTRRWTVVVVTALAAVVVGAAATTGFELYDHGGSAPPPTPPSGTPTPTGPPPADVRACAPPDCAARVTVEPGGRIVVCDNRVDGLSGVAVITGPGGPDPEPVWASRGNGTCDVGVLPASAGAALTVEACTGDRPTNRIVRCGEPVTAPIG
jgi:hypothetical protein